MTGSNAAEASMKKNDQVTRRTFISGAASTSLGFTIVPASVLARPAPSDRLNFGHIGLGGRGAAFCGHWCTWTRRWCLGRTSGALGTATCDRRFRRRCAT